jgi:hypothetical protein
MNLYWGDNCPRENGVFTVTTRFSVAVQHEIAWRSEKLPEQTVGDLVVTSVPKRVSNSGE